MDSSLCHWNLDSRTVILDCQGQLMKIALMKYRCYISFVIFIIIIIIIIIQDYTHHDDHIPPAYDQLFFRNTVSSRQK